MKRAYLVVIAALVLSIGAHATKLNVYCGQKRFPNSINAALKLLMVNPHGPDTLTVYGTCNENILIQSFDNLTLQAAPGGASINDASGGTTDVVIILDSTRITIEGFTINGGGEGVICSSHSLCRFRGNTIQGSAGFGLVIARSGAELTGNFIQNSNATGLVIRQAAQAFTNSDTIQGNGGAGVGVVDGSFLLAYVTTIQNNGGAGVRVADHSTLRSQDSTITGNGGSGILLGGGSEVRFVFDTVGNVVTGNGGNGVTINDLSFANFESSGNNISGNFSQPDVACNPQFSATRGVANIAPGTTNCVEP